MPEDTFIVKVQRPLMSNEAHPSHLVYGHRPRNPHFRERFQRDLPLHVLKALKVEPKAYFHATWDKHRSIWVIGTQAPNQEW